MQRSDILLVMVKVFTHFLYMQLIKFYCCKTEQERDLFLREFHNYLLQEKPESSTYVPNSYLPRATSVYKNLCTVILPVLLVKYMAFFLQKEKKKKIFHFCNYSSLSIFATKLLLHQRVLYLKIVN